MTLQVPFDQFPQTAQRVVGSKEAYVARHGGGVLVTASSASSRTVVAAIAPLAPETAKTQLKAKGLTVHDGAWSAEGLTDLGEACLAETYVAAVAFQSGESRPGIWVDAFDVSPTPAQVLKVMYEELKATGETADVSFEDFVRLANTNVVVVNPAQLRGFLTSKARNPEV